MWLKRSRKSWERFERRIAMWIALLVVSVLMIGGWSAFGLMARKYGLPWGNYSQWLNIKIDQWQGQR